MAGVIIALWCWRPFCPKVATIMVPLPERPKGGRPTGALQISGLSPDRCCQLSKNKTQHPVRFIALNCCAEACGSLRQFPRIIRNNAAVQPDNPGQMFDCVRKVAVKVSARLFSLGFWSHFMHRLLMLMDAYITLIYIALKFYLSLIVHDFCHTKLSV